MRGLGHGVDLRCGVTVDPIRPSPADPATASTVVLGDGDQVAAGVLTVGVGATPNIDLARSSWLDVDDGILVGADLRTCDPDIAAAGDVANAYHPLLRRRLRVEHWANARHQPAVAARTMLGRPASSPRGTSTSGTSPNR